MNQVVNMLLIRNIMMENELMVMVDLDMMEDGRNFCQKSNFFEIFGIAQTRSGMGLGSVWDDFGAISGVRRLFGRSWRLLPTPGVQFGGPSGVWR